MNDKAKKPLARAMAVTQKSLVASALSQASTRETHGQLHAKPYRQFSTRLIKADSAKRIRQIREGIDPFILVDASRHFDITQQRMGQLVGIASATLVRRIKDGRHLGPSETEKLVRIAEIEAEANEVFGSPQKAKEWLFSENKALGEAPITMLDTEIGKSEVRKILNAIAYGGTV